MFSYVHTVCFINLGKLNLLMVVLFLSWSQFSILTQLALKKTPAIKVVKIDTEKINSLPGSKSVKQTV